MKLWNVPESDVTRIVNTVSNEKYDGNVVFKREPEKDGRAVRFTLTVANSRNRGGRRSGSGRRVCACCWHGHRDIMTAIFDEFPNARLQTAQADYRGKGSFVDRFESTGYVNIGSMCDPVNYNEACDCEGNVWE